MTPLTSATEIDIRAAFRNLCGSGVPEEHLADMLATHAIGLLENQRPEWFGDVPRTPETVLRGMLRAYTDAATDAETAYFRADELSADEARADALRSRLDEALVAIRGELGWLCANGEMDTPRDWPEWIGKDYEARLSGARPIDAPPADKDPAT